MKFRRRHQPPGPPADENPYLGLRRQVLTLGADVVDESLRAVVLELGMGGGSATVVCVADGTTSMYTSSGGGYIGMGAHESVRQANARLLAAVASRLEALTPTQVVPLPGDDEVNVIAVTAVGLRLLRCAEAVAQDPSSAAYPLYVAGQEVITQMRVVAEAQGR